MNWWLCELFTGPLAVGHRPFTIRSRTALPWRDFFNSWLDLLATTTRSFHQAGRANRKSELLFISLCKDTYIYTVYIQICCGAAWIAFMWLKTMQFRPSPGLIRPMWLHSYHNVSFLNFHLTLAYDVPGTCRVYSQVQQSCQTYLHIGTIEIMRTHFWYQVSIHWMSLSWYNVNGVQGWVSGDKQSQHKKKDSSNFALSCMWLSNAAAYRMMQSSHIAALPLYFELHNSMKGITFHCCKFPITYYQTLYMCTICYLNYTSLCIHLKSKAKS